VRRVDSGSPEPLGVTPVAGGANVAVFSAHASTIELCLFDADGSTEQERIALPERTGDVFHGRIAGVTAGARYGRGAGRHHTQ
jgi:pullulanase/glycogen debranching enzyme